MGCALCVAWLWLALIHIAYNYWLFCAALYALRVLFLLYSFFFFSISVLLHGQFTNNGASNSREQQQQPIDSVSYCLFVLVTQQSNGGGSGKIVFESHLFGN